MRPISRQYHFDAPIEQVFDLGTDFARYPEWNPFYAKVSRIVGEPTAVGTEIHFTSRILGREFDAVATITEIDAPRYLKLATVRTQGGGSTVFRLTQVATGTDLAVELEVPPLPPEMMEQIPDPAAVERAIGDDLDHSFDKFKALLLAKQPAHV